MQYSLSNSASEGAQIAEIRGRITFECQREFRRLLEEMFAEKVRSYVFDLKGVEFIDSAGLGMLLLGRDRAEKNAAAVVLRNPPAAIKRMLDVAQFYTLFKIED